MGEKVAFALYPSSKNIQFQSCDLSKQPEKPSKKLFRYSLSLGKVKLRTFVVGFLAHFLTLNNPGTKLLFTPVAFHFGVNFLEILSLIIEKCK